MQNKEWYSNIEGHLARIVIYKAIRFDVAPTYLNETTKETLIFKVI